MKEIYISQKNNNNIIDRWFLKIVWNYFIKYFIFLYSVYKYEINNISKVVFSFVYIYIYHIDIWYNRYNI